MKKLQNLTFLSLAVACFSGCAIDNPEFDKKHAELYKKGKALWIKGKGYDENTVVIARNVPETTITVGGPPTLESNEFRLDGKILGCAERGFSYNAERSQKGQEIESQIFPSRIKGFVGKPNIEAGAEFSVFELKDNPEKICIEIDYSKTKTTMQSKCPIKTFVFKGYDLPVKY
jgi:hypothetical protein